MEEILIFLKWLKPTQSNLKKPRPNTPQLKEWRPNLIQKLSVKWWNLKKKLNKWFKTKYITIKKNNEQILYNNQSIKKWNWKKISSINCNKKNKDLI